jgi:hypothetical protein
MIASKVSGLDWNAGVVVGCKTFEELKIVARQGRISTQPINNTRHGRVKPLFYSNAAAIITSTLAPPAYMPFRLDAAPM